MKEDKIRLKIWIITTVVILMYLSETQATILRLEPETVPITEKEQEFVVDIVIIDVIDLMGAEIVVGFDKDSLQVGTVECGELLKSDEYDEVLFFKEIDNLNGKVKITTSRLGGEPEGVTGTGSIATIKFITQDIITDTEIIVNAIDLRNHVLQRMQVSNIHTTTVIPATIPLHHYSIQLPDKDIIAGATFTVTIYACDVDDNVISDYTEEAVLDIQDIGTQSVINFVNGEKSIPLCLTRSGTYTIKVYNPDELSISNHILINVLPDELHSIILSNISTQYAGMPFKLTIKAMDKYGNIVNTFSGEIALTDMSESIDPCVVRLRNGMWTDNVWITTAGTTCITASFGSIEGISNMFNILPAQLSYILVKPQTGTVTIGETIKFDAQGYDVYGNNIPGLMFDWSVIPDTCGALNISSGKTVMFEAKEPGNVILTARFQDKHGSATLTITNPLPENVIIYPHELRLPVGSQTILIPEVFDKKGNRISPIHYEWLKTGDIGSLTSNGMFIAGTKPGCGTITYHVWEADKHVYKHIPVIVTHGNIYAFEFQPIPVAQRTDTKFDIQINAVDKYGNIVKDYNKHVWLTDTINSFKEKYIFINGILKTNIAINTAGSNISLIVTDKENNIIGISNTFNILPGNLTALIIEPEIIPPQICNQGFSITIKAIDEYGNIVDYTGKVSLKDTTESIIPGYIDMVKGIWHGTVSIQSSYVNNSITAGIPEYNIIATTNTFPVWFDNRIDETIKKGNVCIEVKSDAISTKYLVMIDNIPQGYEINQAIYQVGDNSAVLTDSLCKIDIVRYNGEYVDKLQKHAVLKLFYDQDKLSNIDEYTLKICKLHNGYWLPLVNTVVYPSADMVTATIDEPGIFILKGAVKFDNLSNIVVYPNPCYVAKDKYITFTGLPSPCVINIYDISGAVVKTITTETAEYNWDISDNTGKILDSGIYLYVIINNRYTEKGNIAIIR
jgi:hypothetical protein